MGDPPDEVSISTAIEQIGPRARPTLLPSQQGQPRPARRQEILLPRLSELRLLSRLLRPAIETEEYSFDDWFNPIEAGLPTGFANCSKPCWKQNSRDTLLEVQFPFGMLPEVEDHQGCHADGRQRSRRKADNWPRSHAEQLAKVMAGETAD